MRNRDADAQRGQRPAQGHPGHSRLTRGVRPRLEGKPRTPLSSRVATRVSWSPLSGLKGKALRALGFYKHRHIRLTLSPHGSSSSLLMGTEGGEIGPRPSGFYTTLHCLVLKLPVASAAHRAKSEGLAGCSCSHQTPGPTQAQPPAATFPASSRAKAVGHPQPHKGTGHSDSGHISPTLHPRAWGQNQAQAQIPRSENKIGAHV